MNIEFYLGDNGPVRRDWPAAPRVGDMVFLTELGHRRAGKILWTDTLTAFGTGSRADVVVRIELDEIGTIWEVRKSSRSRGAKLDIEQVRQIRTMLAEGHEQKDIAGKFNLTTTSIRNIVTGRTWKGIE